MKFFAKYFSVATPPPLRPDNCIWPRVSRGFEYIFSFATMIKVGGGRNMWTVHI